MSTLLFAAGILQRLATIRPMYVVVWCALGAVSVALVFLMRSRWGRSHPLHRCAVLSLIVHLLLACLAMTVRLVVGNGEAGEGPPIQVRLVDDVVDEVPMAAVTPPPLLEPEEVPAPPEEIEPQDGDVASHLDEAPEETELLVESAEPAVEPPQTAVDEPAAESLAAVVEPAPGPREIVTDSQPTVTDDENSTAVAEAPFTPPETSPATSDSQPVDAPAVGPYARRNEADRLRWAEQQGGSRETEAAVAAALKWLAQAQSADGRWDARRYGAGVELAVLGHDRGGAGADADSGISALAMLAFLGAGHTHQGGGYQPTVERGLRFLIGNQSADGNLASQTGLYAQMYCHSMATFALAEALAITGDGRLEPTVRRAVDYCVRAQHPATGGWRYRAGIDTGDTSQLGWQLMALWSAEQAGVGVPPQTWTGAERFLRSVRRGRHGGLASYRPDGPASTPMTAEALYCRQLVGQILGGNADTGAAAEATAQLLAARPEPNRINLYYWYYATLALHHQQRTSEEAATAWQSWNAALTGVLLDAQVKDGTDTGSWEPNCLWGGYGGRVYTTALGALCLEAYYRFTPTPAEDPWMAARPEIRRLPQ